MHNDEYERDKKSFEENPVSVIMGYLLNERVLSPPARLAHLENVFNLVTSAHDHRGENDFMGELLVPHIVCAFRETVAGGKRSNVLLLLYLEARYQGLYRFTEGPGAASQLYPVLQKTKAAILKEAMRHWKYKATEESDLAFDLLIQAHKASRVLSYSLSSQEKMIEDLFSKTSRNNASHVSRGAETQAVEDLDHWILKEGVPPAILVILRKAVAAIDTTESSAESAVAEAKQRQEMRQKTLS